MSKKTKIKLNLAKFTAEFIDHGKLAMPGSMNSAMILAMFSIILVFLLIAPRKFVQRCLKNILLHLLDLQSKRYSKKYILKMSLFEQSTCAYQTRFKMISTDPPLFFRNFIRREAQENFYLRFSCIINFLQIPPPLTPLVFSKFSWKGYICNEAGWFREVKFNLWSQLYSFFVQN